MISWSKNKFAVPDKDKKWQRERQFSSALLGYIAVLLIVCRLCAYHFGVRYDFAVFLYYDSSLGARDALSSNHWVL